MLSLSEPSIPVVRQWTDEQYREEFAHRARIRDPFIREAACLAIQLPRLFQPMQPGDTLAGRVRWPEVGVSPEPKGLGFYGLPETTSMRVRAACPAWVRERLPSDAWTEDRHPAFPLYRIAGTQLDYVKLVRLGLPGLHAEASPALRSVLDTLDAILADYARQAPAPFALQAIRHQPPQTLREAIQLIWIVALATGTWNYGRLDVVLGDFVCDEDEALALLTEWWRLMAAYDNQYNNRVIVGGVGRPNEGNADRFAMLAMEATRRVRLNQPQLSLRFHQDQDPTLMDKALEVIGEGVTFPILYNDDVNVPAVAKVFSVSIEEAGQYLPYGCGETMLWHRSVSSPNGVINLLKCLELAHNDGCDAETGWKLGPRVTEANLWDAYRAQVRYGVEALATFQDKLYEVVAEECPFMLMAVLYDGPGENLLRKAKLTSAIETYGNTNVADSLCALADGSGHHYGNDDPIADAWAIRVHEHVCRLALENGNHVVLINNWANTLFGWRTAASADGRASGDPLANGNNPVHGKDVSGLTALLNSLAKLRADVHAGVVQNLKLAPSLFGRERAKLEALLGVYFDSGGTQLMITVVCREDLEAAMADPEAWGHLMVRVGGFSARFIDLPRDVQMEVLQRTIHG